MTAFFSLAIFVFGLIAGSFLNCVIYRLETGGNFLRGRSFCPRCKHVLAWRDLIPILSFLVLRGQCRYCKKSISLQYPLVEIATGILFLLFFEVRPPVFNIWEVGPLILIPFLIVIFVYDLKHYLIPDKVIYPVIALALVYDLLRSDLLISAFGAAAFFLFIVLISKGRWMGVGDVKLAFLMGLILGWPEIIVALFLAFLSGAIIGIGLIIADKKSLKSEVPFGPFLVAGTFVALFWGERIINWYLSFYV